MGGIFHPENWGEDFSNLTFGAYFFRWVGEKKTQPPTHEDDDLLAVSKPPFLRVTPVHRFLGKSLTNQVLGYLQGKYGEGYESAMVLHRLDQTTSGLVLCAKNKEAARSCGDRWHDDACRKEYLAIALPQGPCESWMCLV